MKTKEKNTGPPTEEPRKGLFKSKKDTPTQAAKKFESALPEVAKRNNIRVSSPYGYYPEDVDKVILELEKDTKMLQKENTHLTKQLEECKHNVSALQSELTQLKMQMSLMEIPDVSSEEGVAMLSRIGTVTGRNEEQIQNNIVKTPIKPHNITIVKSSSTSTSTSTVEVPKKSSAVISLNLSKKEK